MSLQDIEQKFDVGRRTAMRMRDAILRNFPQAEEVETDERIKRWRLPSGVLNQLVYFSADELADLEFAGQLLRDRNRLDQAANLETMSAKIRALMDPNAFRMAEPDLEALLEAEGLATRPGPRPQIEVQVVEALRQAIKGCNRVKIRYRRRSDGKVTTRTVEPYGFLHGHRHYLIAWNRHLREGKFLTFSLPNIENVKVLDEYFERDPIFSLEDFAAQSFGFFQESPFDVEWLFSPKAADTAADFQFHPTQEMKRQKDGSLLVQFRAGSDLEMAWHLYMWGDQVDVIKPKSLAKMTKKHRAAWEALP